MEVSERVAAALERLADASETLNRLATDERDSGDSILGPPFCPHCGVFNPEIRNEGGDGEMADFVLVAVCGKCSNKMYAVPQGWMSFATPEEAISYKEGRESDNGTRSNP